jgi:hypothetical protein
MYSAKILALAITAVGVGFSGAAAADLPPISQKAPAFVKEVGRGWNLRGDIRFSPLASLGSPRTPNVVLSRGFDAAPFYLLGQGYQFDSWVRADPNRERLGSANFHGLMAYASGETFSGAYAADDSE